MKNLPEKAWQIFETAVIAYHKTDSVDAPEQNPYESGSLEYFLYHKNWTDSVQWHLEDIIRDEDIDPVYALTVKRRIDKLNQERTDTVEKLDDCLLEHFGDIAVTDKATLSTETPAWAIDRLSILSLKIYHMNIEAERELSGEKEGTQCCQKLKVLLQQKLDLSLALTQLLQNIEKGNIQYRTYRQMKMYNDADLNPVLYRKIKK